MEDNKLISEFMGAEWHKDFFKDVCIISPSNISYKFHTSWEWLMPVVIKIGGTANILGAMKKLRNYSKVTNREDTYQAVVEFIKTYNDGRM